ncbi:uncharacterized protein LOC113389256 [Ctenocephalides felis]|uniref:uncharacterized protein LOC113389256 n=1 Tax=Ctenocephalides felis TaxID=7515 RepID=UPI000E6E3A57|nr:uncharacterized protein LOC113389256 [Ctenocephalides felis]
MTHKRSLEALNRTLKDLRDNQNIFGGAMILLSGDFRQTLPVIPRSTVADKLRRSLKSSNWWRHVKKLQLSTNMRVVLQQDETAKVFSKQLLNIENGECFTYKSVDTATNQDDILNYPTEFLNSLELPRLPPHNLQLKVGSVVIMLRNLNQPILCNGTRLVVKTLMNNNEENNSFESDGLLQTDENDKELFSANFDVPFEDDSVVPVAIDLLNLLGVLPIKKKKKSQWRYSNDKMINVSEALANKNFHHPVTTQDDRNVEENDEKYLLNVLKEEFNRTTDRSKRMKMSTLFKDWSYRKIQHHFPLATNHMIKTAKNGY